MHVWMIIDRLKKISIKIIWIKIHLSVDIFTEHLINIIKNIFKVRSVRSILERKMISLGMLIHTWKSIKATWITISIEILAHPPIITINLILLYGVLSSLKRFHVIQSRFIYWQSTLNKIMIIYKDFHFLILKMRTLNSMFLGFHWIIR